MKRERWADPAAFVAVDRSRSGRWVRAFLRLSSLVSGTGLFIMGTAVLVLLFTGIHNVWDVIAYHVLVR